MKTKRLIFNRIILFLMILFIWKPFCSEGSVSRKYLENNLTKTEIEVLDNKTLQSIVDTISEYDPIILKSITIKLYNGVVYISGIVNTLRDKEKTIAIIKTVNGVRGVVDYTILTQTLRRDKDIKDDIVVSFLNNLSIYAPRVKVNVLDAVVTLSGLVANPWEEEEAVNAAKGIAGVVIVKNDLSVNSSIRLSNRELIDAIKGMIASDEYLFNNTITVKILKGRVILQGVVDTTLEKRRLAAKILLLGVKELGNQLSIEEYSILYVQKNNLSIEDLDIEKAINDTIHQDDRIDLSDFEIFVKNGCVTLKGSVKNVYQKNFLEQDILNVPGVLFIDNTLIAREKNRKDESIVMDVNRVLQSQPDFAELGIIIACDAGEVTMNGTIDSIAEEALLERNIRNVSGVKQIFNHLQIKPTSASLNKSTDSNEKRDSSDMLHWDMNIANLVFQISVDRYEKTVTIQGEVKDMQQKDRAGELVRLRSPHNFAIINEISIIN